MGWNHQEGARLILGSDLQKAASGQQADTMRRILGERLLPVVLQLMADEEESSDDVGWNIFSHQIPQRPWPACLGLRLSGASVEWMPGYSSLAEHALEELLFRLVSSAAEPTEPRPPAVLCWRGRVIGATPAWRSLKALDRGVLVAMANAVGPHAFGESRSLVLEEMDNLWVRKDMDGATEAQHQMLSVRLYPDRRYIPSELHESISDARKREDASLVLSVLAPLQTCKDNDITLPALRDSALLCSKEGSLPFLWQRLLGKTDGLLRLGTLSTAILLDERSGDVAAFPALTCRSKQAETTTSLRRTVYWFHALPPLSSSCSQRFVSCEGYVIAAARREDGILCWACSNSNSSNSVKPSDSESAQTTLTAVLQLLKHLPRAPNLWSALGALEAPGL